MIPISLEEYTEKYMCKIVIFLSQYFIATYILMNLQRLYCKNIFTSTYFLIKFLCFSKYIFKSESMSLRRSAMSIASTRMLNDLIMRGHNKVYSWSIPCFILISFNTNL